MLNLENNGDYRTYPFIWEADNKDLDCEIKYNVSDQNDFNISCNNDTLTNEQLKDMEECCRIIIKLQVEGEFGVCGY